MKESTSVIETFPLILVSHFVFRFFYNGEIIWATVSHFFRSVGKTCLKKWSKKGDLQWQRCLAGWLFVSFLDSFAGSLLGFLRILRTLYLDRPCLN